MNWRGWNRALHRDLGYLAVGLTVVYALSGVLLNHLHDWNSNWRIERVRTRVEPWPDPASFGQADIPVLLAMLGEQAAPTGTFRPDPGSVTLFFEEGRIITVDLRTGEAAGEVARARPLLGRLNALHLNRAGKAWTRLADLYSLALLLLAFTGLFVLRGRQGLAGRGAWLTAAGILIPLATLLLLR